ncbi:MmoB/DmpM family protein [Mycobacterium sp. SM1]|uniref:MmoB/DmpM family protein n=1 Tax=Mycobacterium sp. SM1 TaxID=2816243 RepID=UPI001BCB51E1|nr:MmoB/DmpM family protein [Mycobacterium sp. SM1]MBS4730318.1 MmoB/DmpM family protein [Mycobacterium sp. SM1]
MTETRTRRVRPVGVDLQDTEDNRVIIDAIERDNPGADVLRMPGLVKITSPGHLVIRRSTVEELLGRPWETHEFQLAIVSYVGHIAEWDEDEILIKWEH